MPPKPADATPVIEAQKRAPADLKAVADFLRDKNGPKVRRGVLNGKRVDYFKGKTAVRTLLGPQYQKLKKVPPVTTEEEAAALLGKVIPFGFFLRVDRRDVPAASGMPKTLDLAPKQQFDPSAQYAWFYDGSPFWNIVGGVAMVAVMLAGVMFPLWPVKLRIGAWYLSVGALCLVGAFIVLAIVRLIFWCFTKLCLAKAIWMFPNLFEDVGFVDSFIPLWAWDEPKKKRLRKVGEKRSRKEKEKAPAAVSIGAPAPAVAEATATPAAAAAEGGSAATTTATPTAAPTLRSRQAATVEEIDDE